MTQPVVPCCPAPSASTAAAGWARASPTPSSSPAPTVVVVETDEAAAAAARERVDRQPARRRGARQARGQRRGGARPARRHHRPGRRWHRPAWSSRPSPRTRSSRRGCSARSQEAAPDAVLATNTSSLSVDGLAAGLRAPAALRRPALLQPGAGQRPGRDRGRRGTPPTDLVEAAQGWVEALGKTAITVTDSPGFASSRLGVAIALEAMRMLEEGVASAEDIDTAMTLGYRHPVGPLRTTDIVGLDVRLAIAEHLARELGARFDAAADPARQGGRRGAGPQDRAGASTTGEPRGRRRPSW